MTPVHPHGRLALLTAVAAASLLAAGPAVAAPRYTFKLAHVIGAGTPIDVAARRFAELVRQRTGGDVEIEVFPAARLGAERAIIEGVRIGTIEMSFTTTGAMGGFAPELQVLDLPYLFPSYEAAYTYLDGEHGRRLLALLDRRGIHGVVFLENGWRNFTSSRNPLRRPEDLKGQKIRVMESPMYMGLVRALKATPTPMAYSELPAALRENAIDGQENPSVNVYSAGMFESQPYMIQDRHTYNVFVFKVNGRLWRSLPDDLRATIEATAAEVRDFQRKLNREVDGHFVRLLREKGMKVHDPSKEDVAAWQAATAPLYEEAKKIVGGSWVAETVQFRKDWDGGKYRSEERRYVERYAEIAVPVEQVMKQFR
jgi:tripartite ATP-independent transporter DctP family solute receptor